MGDQAGKMAAADGWDVSFFGLSFVALISTLMTILILVISEIIPKTIGATYWKNLGNFTAKALNIILVVLKYTGILWLLLKITNWWGNLRT